MYISQTRESEAAAAVAARGQRRRCCALGQRQEAFPHRVRQRHPVLSQPTTFNTEAAQKATSDVNVVGPTSRRQCENSSVSVVGWRVRNALRGGERHCTGNEAAEKLNLEVASDVDGCVKFWPRRSRKARSIWRWRLAVGGERFNSFLVNTSTI